MDKLTRLEEENRILRFTRDAVTAAINAMHDIVTGKRDHDNNIHEIINFGLEVTDIGNEVIEKQSYADFWSNPSVAGSAG